MDAIYSVIFNVRGRLEAREVVGTWANDYTIRHMPGFVRIVSRRPVRAPEVSPRAPYGHFAGKKPANHQWGAKQLPKKGDGWWVPKHLRHAPRRSREVAAWWAEIDNE